MNLDGAVKGLNPYFIGLPILIDEEIADECLAQILSQSLFYWITYSYNELFYAQVMSVNVSILILLDYLFL